jgi:HTH-type transcriptional regulator/antitoxin HipB
MKREKVKTYLEKRLKDKKFRKLFEQEYINVVISEKLAKMRLESHLTQAQLARKIHTKKSAISRYESGKYSGFSMPTLLKLANACGKEMKIDFVSHKKRRKAQTA